MAGTTHIAWMADMEKAVAVTKLLAQRNQQRIDGVTARGGDTSQMVQLLNARKESLDQAAAVGEQIMAAADGIHVDIGAAIAQAGKGWTAEDKGFHTGTR